MNITSSIVYPLWIESWHHSRDLQSVRYAIPECYVLQLLTHMNTLHSAVSFWQYQIHQESSFQQAILRNVNERNAQMQKQLENVVREGMCASLRHGSLTSTSIVRFTHHLL